MERALDVGAAILIAAVLVWAVWSFSKTYAYVTHCHDSLAGPAVKEGTSGRIVCIRRDSVLKVYE